MSGMKVTRIGPGVPVRQEQKPKRWFGIKPKFVIAAAVIVAMGMMITAVFVFDGRTSDEPAQSPSPNGALTEVQVECANVKHAYANWHAGLGKLTGLQNVTGPTAQYATSRLIEDADTFAAATNGYPDKPSKQLRSAVLQYRVDVGFVDLRLRSNDRIDVEYLELNLAALESAQKAEESYKAFLAQTCA